VSQPLLVKAIPPGIKDSSPFMQITCNNQL